MTSITFTLSDKFVTELSQVTKNAVESVIKKFDLRLAAYVYETVHGHIIELQKQEGFYFLGEIEKPGRMDAEDMQFFMALPGFRWVEMASDGLKVGLHNQKDIVIAEPEPEPEPEPQQQNVKVAVFRQKIDHLYKVFNVDRHACQGKKEIAYWSDIAKRNLAELKQMKCNRANEEDNRRYHDVIEKVTNHLANQ